MKPIAYNTLYEYVFKKAPDKEQVIADFFTAKITSDNYQGMSVLRSYDKCRIRLRDKVEDFGIITEIFKYDGDVILKNTKNITMSLFEVEKKKVTRRAFTTHATDNIEIFEGDTYFYVSSYRSGTFYYNKCTARDRLFEVTSMMKYYFGKEENADALVKELNCKL